MGAAVQGGGKKETNGRSAEQSVGFGAGGGAGRGVENKKETEK